MISGIKSKVTYKDVHAKVLFIVKNVDMNRQVIRTVRRSTKCKRYT